MIIQFLGNLIGLGGKGIGLNSYNKIIGVWYNCFVMNMLWPRWCQPINIFFAIELNVAWWGLLFGELQTHSNKYAMPLLKDTFDAFG
jgi:hypothetical protein